MSEGVSKIAPFLTSLYVAKFLNPELFGKYSLIAVTYEIVFILVSFNIQATTRIDFFREDWEKFCEIKKHHLVISLFIFVLLSLVLWGVLDLNFLVVLCLLVSSLLRTLSVFILAVFQCMKKVNSYIVINTVFVLVLSGTTFLLVNLGYSYYSWLYAMLFASLFQAVISLKLFGILKFISSFGYRMSSLNLAQAKLTFVAASLFLPQSVGWWLRAGADRYSIKINIGDYILGQYSLSYQLASILVIFVNVLNLAIVPNINTFLKNKQQDRVDLLIRNGVYAVVAVTFFIAAAGSFTIKSYYINEYPLSQELFVLLLLSFVPQAFMMLIINELYFKNLGLFVAKIVLFVFLSQAIVNYCLSILTGVYGMIYSSILFNFLLLLLIHYKRQKVKETKYCGV